jgi:HEAT repeat protein
MRNNQGRSRAAASQTGWYVSGHLVLPVILSAAVTGTFTAHAIAQPPGPELFAKEPQTPLELWGAVDYLIRTDQVRKAVPYLEKFVKSQPDDATMIAIRDQYGPGSILQLEDYGPTQHFARPLVEALAAAAHKQVTQPRRIAHFVNELTGTPEEQEYAIRHLRKAEPQAVPFLVGALTQPDLTAPKRELLVHNMGRLDRFAVPPLIAALDSADPPLVLSIVRVLGMIGDPETVPHLMFVAADPSSAPEVRSAAQTALAQFSGYPFTAHQHTAVEALTAAAWRYHRHQIDLTEDPVTVWTWDRNQKALTARSLPQNEADASLGLRLVDQALRLDPMNRDAQVVQLSLTLERAVRQTGWGTFPATDRAALAAAKNRGPSVLSAALKAAIADGKMDLAAALTMALGEVTDRSALASTSQPHPLVEALYAPSRRVQLTAAKAIVTLAPTQSFPGSSRVVPTLARFVGNLALPRAVVIDNNPNRGSQLAGFLINLGYDAGLEPSSVQGFRSAAERANVELILISFDLFYGWGLNDTLANFRADSRTAAIPLVVYGPLDLAIKRPDLVHDYPGLRFVVQPADAATLQLQLKNLPSSLTREELAGYAQEAVSLLVRITQDQRNPMASSLITAEPALAAALRQVENGDAAATILSEIPSADAQRSLADLLLDPSQPAARRNLTAAQLARSIQRFGPLMTADQEARLVAVLNEETDPQVQFALLTITRVLSPAARTRSIQPPQPAAEKPPAPSSTGAQPPARPATH